MKSEWTSRVPGRGLEWNREMPHHILLFMGGGVEGCREEPLHRQAQRWSAAMHDDAAALTFGSARPFSLFPSHFRERKRRRTRDSAGLATSAQAAIMSISNTTNRTQLRFYAGRRRPFSLSLSGLAFRVGLLNSPGEIVLSFRPRTACTGRAQKHFIII